MSISDFILKYSLVKSISVPIKLGLTALFSLFVIIYLLVSYVGLENKDIAFRSKEIHGTRFIPTLYQAISNTQITRGLTNSKLNGSSTLDNQILEARAKALAAMNNIDKLVEQYGELGQIQQKAQSIKRDFEALNSRAFNGQSSDVFSQYTDIVTRLRTLIMDVGDASNLTLDPELHTFYLMDYLVFRAHVTAEATGLLRGLGAGMISSNNYNRDQLIDLSRILGTANFGAANDSLSRALSAEPSFSAALSPIISNSLAKQSAFSDQVLSLIENNYTTLSADEFFRLGTETIGSLYNGVEEVNQLLYQELKLRVDDLTSIRNTQVATVGTFLCVVVYVFVVTILSIVVNLRKTRVILSNVAKGDLTTKLEVLSNDEFKVMAESLNDTQRILKTNIETERAQAEEMATIKTALDSTNTVVMIADNDLNIVYVNNAAVQMMERRGDQLKTVLPTLDYRNLVGSNVDQFHKNPAHQRSLLGSLSDTYKSSITVAGLSFNLTATPLFNFDKKRSGTVIEWEDRTDEVVIQGEIDDLIGSAAHGDLSKRINIEGKVGFFASLSEGLNHLVSIAEGVVSDTARVFSALSHGDLTEVIETQYEGAFGELKNDANATVSKLTEIITQIREAANTVTTGADEIAQGNADLSQRTEEQASSLEETASSMEQMTSAVKSSAENAMQANEISSKTRTLASSGGQVVDQAVKAMGEINESSKHIADIIGVIDEIAFQTNLLALNAAVEAARAGEQGRGFAVVASEVRNLAQRSAGAAKEIKDLIRDSVDKVTTGSELVNRSGATLQDIVESVQKVSSMVEDISNSAREQSSGIEQVNKAVTQMDEMTQQNAALVEEATAAGEGMAEQARKLMQQMAFFTLSHDKLGHSPQVPRVKASNHLSPMSKPSSAPQASGNPNGHSKPASSKPNLTVSDEDDDWEEF